MNTAHKGRRAEHRARRLLEGQGYIVTRAAGSKGAADLIGWNATAIRFISVKSGSTYLSRTERAALAALPVPANATKEVWRFPDRCRSPVVETLPA